MHDAGRVRGGERTGHLEGNLNRLMKFHASTGKPFVQCFALDEFAGDVARRIGAAHLVNRHDVRVIQPGDRTRFPLESSETLRIICEVRR